MLIWEGFQTTHPNVHNAHAGLECHGTVSGNDRIYSVYWESPAWEIYGFSKGHL